MLNTEKENSKCKMPGAEKESTECNLMRKKVRNELPSESTILRESSECTRTVLLREKKYRM